MTIRTHNFNIRFYSLNQEHGYNFRTLVNHFKNDSMPVIVIGNFARRIHIFSDNSGIDNSISGYFSTYREDIFHKGNKKTGVEELLTLDDDESIIERSYFTIFYKEEKEILLYHNPSLYGHIRNFEGYITNLTKEISNDRRFYPITVAEIGAEEFSPDKKNGTLTEVEYKISRPKSKKPRPGEDEWVQEQFDEMKSLGITTQRVTLRSNKGLLPEAWNTVKKLLDLDRTQILKVKVRDIEQPIDLLHNILKDGFSICGESRKEVAPEKIFSEIRKLKEKHYDTLKNYLE